MDTETKKYEVNGEIVWSGNLYKIEGKLCDKPVHFYIRPLNAKDSQAMGELSQNIYNHLKEGEECFIHRHTQEYYDEVFTDKKTHYFGVFVGSKLIGMSYLKECDSPLELEGELPNAKYDFFNSPHNINTKVASFGGDSVLPIYRGNALNTIMINYRLQMAERLGCTDCTSIIDRNNRWNMTPYFTCRFNLFETAIDPSDGGKISLLHKPVDAKTVLSQQKNRVSIPYERLDMIDKLIQRGYIGIEFNKDTLEVMFAHSHYYHPTKVNERLSPQSMKKCVEFTL